MGEWIVPVIIGVLFGGFCFLFALMLEGFNPNETGRRSNAIGFGVLMGVAAVVVVRFLEWVVLRR